MKKQSKWILYALCFVSLLVSISVAYNRSTVEQGQKQYDIMVKYTDVINISKQNSIPYTQVLKELKEVGVNVLFVPENKILSDGLGELASYEAQGMATSINGYDLLREVSEDEKDKIKPEYKYIECLQDHVRKNIETYLIEKGYAVSEVLCNKRAYLEIPRSKVLTTVGVGFNEEDIQEAADLGYTICPQILSLTTDGEQGISYIANRLSELPNLGPIFFADGDVTCYLTEEMEALLGKHGIGFTEFYSNKQKGFTSLVKASLDSEKAFNMYRLHTLTDGELDKYEGIKLFDRFELALTERGIGYFLFKVPKKHTPSLNYEILKSNISEFKQIAANKGFTQGELKPLNFKTPSYIQTLLAGLGAICIFVLLCMELKQEKLGCVLGVVGLIGYACLLMVRGNIAIQLMALFITIMFPTYAMVIGLKNKQGSLLNAAKGLVTIVGIATVGAMSFVGTMSRTEYALGIQLFKGVKVSLMTPVLLVGIMLLYKEELLQLKTLQKWIKMPITYLVAGIAVVFAGIFLIYMIRSGNSGTVSETQIAMRQALKDLFGTRPRTKEFLVSYPIIMCLIYFGKHKLWIPLSVLATVGPASVVNTFTHTHIPVLISCKRTVFGVLLGFIIGVMLIYGIKLVIKVLKPVYNRYFSV